jgi:hypothetical protein
LHNITRLPDETPVPAIPAARAFSLAFQSRGELVGYGVLILRTLREGIPRAGRSLAASAAPLGDVRKVLVTGAGGRTGKLVFQKLQAKPGEQASLLYIL